MTTLDVWCKEHSVDNITAMKIDVEGFELEVLRGAEASMNSRLMLGVVEAEESLQHRNGSSVGDITEFLERFGYSTKIVSGCWTPDVACRSQAILILINSTVLVSTT